MAVLDFARTCAMLLAICQLAGAANFYRMAEIFIAWRRIDSAFVRSAGMGRRGRDNLKRSKAHLGSVANGADPAENAQMRYI
jgi:hypothetical protein